MKKRKTILIPSIISGVLSLIIFAIEGIWAYTAGTMPYMSTVFGGDCTEYVGIGWTITEVYPCEPYTGAASTYTYISFNYNIIIFFILIWIMVYVILKIINKRKNNK